MVFHRHLNEQDSNIQLLLKHSHDSIHFLDLRIYRSSLDSARLSHRVAFKPTACHRLLPWSSNHAAHVHRGLIYSHLLRWSLCSSTRQDFDECFQEVTRVWKTNGVSRSLIRSCKQKVFSLTELADDWSPGFSKCNGPRCSACRFALETSVFGNASRNCLFPVRFSLSCASTHTIYMVVCSRCNVRYVGQTSHPVRQRLSQHLRAIRTRDLTSPLVPHFTDFHNESDLRFFSFDRCFKDHNRVAKESRWIRVLHTASPAGLNRIVAAPSNTVNLVTSPGLCTDRLNSVIRRECSLASDVRVRLCYKTDRNLRSILR